MGTRRGRGRAGGEEHVLVDSPKLILGLPLSVCGSDKLSEFPEKRSSAQSPVASVCEARIVPTLVSL